MTRKQQTRPKSSKVKALKDLSARPLAAKVKAGYKLERCFVKSWSTSGG